MDQDVSKNGFVSLEDKMAKLYFWFAITFKLEPEARDLFLLIGKEKKALAETLASDRNNQPCPESLSADLDDILSWVDWVIEGSAPPTLGEAFDMAAQFESDAIKCMTKATDAAGSPKQTIVLKALAARGRDHFEKLVNLAGMKGIGLKRKVG